MRCRPRLARAAPLDRPQLVVAVLDVRGGDADLAGDPGLAGELPPAAPAATAGHRDVDPGQRAADAHPVARPGGVDLGERDVGDRQRLGHPVRGVRRRRSAARRAARAAAPRAPARRRRRPGGRRPGRRAEPASSPAAVATTLRSAAGEAKTIVASTAATASASAAAVRAPGFGVHVGHGRRDPERRAVERERREGGDEPVVPGDPVRRAQGRELRPRLPVPVDHALRRAGGAGREQDRGLVVRPGLDRQRRAAVQQRPSPPGERRQPDRRAEDAPQPGGTGPVAIRLPGIPSAAASARPGQGADDVRGVRAAQGPREPGGTQPGVGHHDGRPGPPAGVRGGGQVGAGRDEQRDPVAGGHPVLGEPGGQLVHPADEQVPRDRPPAGLHDGGGGVAGAGLERGPQSCAVRCRAPGTRGPVGRPGDGRRCRSGTCRRSRPTRRRPPPGRPPARGATPARSAGRPRAAAAHAGRAGSGRRTPGRAAPTAAAPARRRACGPPRRSRRASRR